MRFQFSGDFSSLATFGGKVVSAPTVMEKVGRQLAEETVNLIREGFEFSRDPDGNPWKPLVLREGRPLEDTGGLKASFFVKSSGKGGFIVSSAKRYAKYHQGGTGIYGRHEKPIKAKSAKALRMPGPLFRKSVKGTPKRKMIPEPGQVPASWTNTFKDVAGEVLEMHFKSSRRRR